MRGRSVEPIRPGDIPVSSLSSSVDSSPPASEGEQTDDGLVQFVTSVEEVVDRPLGIVLLHLCVRALDDPQNVVGVVESVFVRDPVADVGRRTGRHDDGRRRWTGDREMRGDRLLQRLPVDRVDQEHCPALVLDSSLDEPRQSCSN